MSVPSDRFSEFKEWVASALVMHPEWRYGQACFNVLYEDFDPRLANRIRGGTLDPFYNDSLIPAFLDEVESAWLAGGAVSGETPQ